MSLRRQVSAPFWFFLLFFTLAAFGCSGASYIKASVPDNPLQRVAQQAEPEWSVERVDENTLHLRDSWPIHSIFALGYSASYAHLFYDPSVSELNIQYYFKSYQPITLWVVPFSLDAEPGFAGGALKPTMNQQIDDILRWSGATVTSRRGGSTSEPFPPKKEDGLAPPLAP
ncbi:hypothetical protein [Candidatus Manganitrophus noduliformans]|uniref:Lipoprotein n=1 Tax=Candidatus Manganitrophus noduliformans TaxID=2606439 RepID=A0A7X6IC64_9BACT|nr:hypothetical protein [Candidatus Manganitrophus noduliformans]NKE72160.1 hypothetical protein [Candidatus Manganitrophus noduliformans]